jgi:hypothetical protein
MKIIASLLLLAALTASAQVTDTPITSWPTAWRGVVTSGTVNPPTGCIAGWSRPADRYADWQMSVAFVDGAQLAADAPAAIASAVAAQNLGALNALRTADVGQNARPCTDKLGPRPLAWYVSPLASGKRRAYTLLPDGTRGAVSGIVLTLTDGAATRCNCLVRSVETTTSTYCAVKTDVVPDRVTLCLLAK